MPRVTIHSMNRVRTACMPWLPFASLAIMLALGTVISCRENKPVEGLQRSAASSPTTRGAVNGPSPITAAGMLPEDWRATGFAYAPARDGRDKADIEQENRGCVTCHIQTDSPHMHTAERNISCVDCHGGNARVAMQGKDAITVSLLSKSDPKFLAVEQSYHVQPSPATADLWKKNGFPSSGNPEIPGSRTLGENVDYIRFVNPGDLRAARMACGACHNTAKEGFIVEKVAGSMMAHGAMLWGAALYNNGSINRKDAVYGELYTLGKVNGRVAQVPATIAPTSKPTAKEQTIFGWLPQLFPLPRWEVSQPGNILRVFENGGKSRPVIGIPEVEEDPGRPDVKLSVRGFGTDVRTDPVFIGLQKTRLMDPTLNLFGTNDHPGDYRASGCSACHVVYANDRSPVHSAAWAKYGNRGQSFSADSRVNSHPGADPATRPATNAGHPIAHVFVKNMPTSTCMVCHMHPGTNVLNSFLGFTWWDNETDGEFMYPKWQGTPSAEQEQKTYLHNPEGSSVRGLWSNRFTGQLSHAGKRVAKDFLENLTSLNPELKHTQFADFHGHGWVFRAVFKQDRHGNLLNASGGVVENPDAAALAAGVAVTTEPIPPPRLDKGKIEDLDDLKKTIALKQSKAPPTTAPVHLKDIHLEKGMQCVDCHFQQDAHGDGHLYGETRNAVLVDCIDCHGSAGEPPRLLKALESMKKAEDKKNENESLNQLATKALRRAFNGAAAAKLSDEQILHLKSTLREHFTRLESDDEGQGPILFQKSALEPKKGWVVKSVADTVLSKPPPLWDTESKEQKKRSAMARYAHSVRKKPISSEASPAKIEFGLKKDELKKLASGQLEESDVLAHANSAVACYTCHSSWNTSCFGCHLSMRANQNMPMLHNEGQCARNYTNYNYQTLRDDVYMLGIDSTVRNHRVVPVRSACAVLVSSQDAERQWIYTQQQTISAEGFAGTAFSPYFPHTVRTQETKTCYDCHLSRENDNNAVLAQLMLQGTHAVNFIGRFAWVGQGGAGLEAVAVTERDEPQAVLGSKLHRLAHPEAYAKHLSRGMKLDEVHEHAGTIYDLQQRGEYLYAACGADGFIAYDIANLDNKGFSERIVTAPVSPFGQRLYVRTPDARCVVSPSTLAIDPTRDHLLDPSRGEVNEEQKIHPLYAYLYIADMQDGLVVVGNRPGPAAARKSNIGVATLLDGDPTNNFLTKALSYNPDHLLDGAQQMTIAGHYAYICCRLGLAVVNLDDPLAPKIESFLRNDKLHHPRKVAFQFRYGFVLDDDGLKVLNVTDLSNPKLVEGATLPLSDARDIYVSRTFGYVAAGGQGLVVVDLENPESLRPETISESPFDPLEFRKKPTDRTRRAMRFTAGDRLNDACAVKVGMTNNSLFAYIADGRNGLKVLQLSSDETPGFNGYTPTPSPKLIAEHQTHGRAVALGGGLDRDRAVDESGHQLSVFGRRGARPLNLFEQRRMFLNNPLDPSSGVWRVSENPADAVDVGK
jgi:hypothetical protein